MQLKLQENVRAYIGYEALSEQTLVPWMIGRTNAIFSSAHKLHQLLF